MPLNTTLLTRCGMRKGTRHKNELVRQDGMRHGTGGDIIVTRKGAEQDRTRNEKFEKSGATRNQTGPDIK